MSTSDRPPDPPPREKRNRFSIKTIPGVTPGLTSSLLAHAVVLFLLGMYYLPALVDFRPDLTLHLDELESFEEMDLFEDDEESFDFQADAGDDLFEPEPIEVEASEAWDETELASIPQSDVEMETNITADIGELIGNLAQSADTGSLSGSALSGRRNKGAAVAQNGGSEESEKAVALALAWIADHQLPNGAWSYTQLINPNCRGRCRDTAIDETNRSLVSATAMALLPMLGYGITHKEGKYQKQVKAGLDYIASNALVTPEGIVLAEAGSTPIMYHHGLATIVVCEAAAMTRDRKLEKLAQGAVDYIAWAQDPIGGGWRYVPKQPGDTSGLGWNFMALKSAEMADLRVPIQTFQGTRHFLDNVVGAEGGAKYGYLSNNPNHREGLGRGVQALTAIGLLGQMYLGRKQDHPGLIKGTDYLEEWGPSTSNLYYSYYATQVMHHFGGEKWERWNRTMRDELIRTQIKQGHEQGSWYTTGGLLKSSGRLGSTSFATMILEVYYRHMPLYRRTATIDSFPLD